MAYKKVERTPMAWNSKGAIKEGDSIEGILKLVEHNQGTKKNSTIYTLDVDGQDVGVWGSVILDDLMSSVKIGNKIKIVFNGKKETSAGGSYNLYELFIDEDFNPLNEGEADENSVDEDEEFLNLEE